jgi:UPF0716 protein FxsA
MPVLFILFVVLPIAEIMVLINVSNGIGTLNTFLIVIITAFFGAYFVRQQGFALVQQLQTKISSGQAPSSEMAEGILLLIAGVLLITPGFITDGLGFLFTLPFSRAPIARFIMSKITSKIVSGRGGAGFHFHQEGQGRQQNQDGFESSFNRQSGGRNDDGEIIEGEIVEPKNDQKQEPSHAGKTNNKTAQEQIIHEVSEKNRSK